MNLHSYCSKCFCRRSKYLLSTFSSLGSKPTRSFFETEIMSNGSMKFSDSQKKHKNATNIQYEEAVKALNGLQSNAAYIEEFKKQNQRHLLSTENVFLTKVYLERAGILLSELDHLPIIHVAGTKGKGSTCAFVESILREYGYKTGFFSSPHLVAVRERIRINGVPIGKNEFSYYFWDVYDTLQSRMTGPKDIPPYFKFLTILAYKIFLKEEVDVAIIEVGIGGEYDSTNVVRRPVVCGITSLDMDHTAILGNTIEEIAWNKAGIMKPNTPTFTVEQQFSGAFSVLQKRAEEKEIQLFVSPPLENYNWGGRPIHLGLSGYVQFMNASLALQLAHYFMRRRGSDVAEGYTDEICGAPFTLSQEDILALGNVNWPGRSQVLVKNDTTFFLDGAHTALSIQGCVKWYNKVSLQNTPPGKNIFKVLVFNVTGDRDHVSILTELFSCNFDLAIFTTNLVTGRKNASSDQTNFTVSDASQIARCQVLRKFWLKLVEEKNSMEETIGMAKASQTCLTFHCIQDVLLWLSCGRSSLVEGEMTRAPDFPPPERLRKASQVQVLITGSLHLVGGFLSFLDPSLSIDGEDSSTTSLADLVKKKYAHARSDTTGAR